ncbi:hypothetical protein Taro_026485 [Colocasia esculenta]|uniref:Single-stranded DNA-binding protein, mitochondrial n=1 Tax=Colocasia esculenta TaxID=4460 RepID=A0A843VFC0_COLES|nr:hypothetical protein [Colocasia esculenta]
MPFSPLGRHPCSMAGRFVKCLRSSVQRPGFSFDAHKGSRLWCSAISFDEYERSNVIDDDELIPTKSELEPQGVDPKRGWGFRGVHKAIICGKIGQAPIQKILRNGKTVTIFTVGTGGMYDQRILGSENLPRPAQWHRIAVHNELLGAYSVQQLTKNSPVFVEGDIETRVYNDSINGQVKNVPEICVRRDGHEARRDNLRSPRPGPFRLGGGDERSGCLFSPMMTGRMHRFGFPSEGLSVETPVPSRGLLGYRVGCSVPYAWKHSAGYLVADGTLFEQALRGVWRAPLRPLGSGWTSVFGSLLAELEDTWLDDWSPDALMGHDGP